MKSVFADSFYYLALINPHDGYHELAKNWAIKNAVKIVTTEWILTEVGDALIAPRTRFGLAIVLEQVQSDPRTDVIPSSSKLFRSGCQLFNERPDKYRSLTDCISFVVMKQRRIDQALTTDHHFEQAGFVSLLSSTTPQ